MIKRYLAKRYFHKAIAMLAKMKKDKDVPIKDTIDIFKNLQKAYMLIDEEEPRINWGCFDFEALLSQVVTDIQRLS